MRTDEADHYEVYVRDAQGNPMAMYKGTVQNGGQTVNYRLTERNRYGSARLGTDLLQVDPLVATDPLHLQHAQGFMRYEVADHLGNVHVTLTDHKNAKVTDDNEVGSFLADLTMQADYQPFGSLLPGRYAQRQEGRWIIAIPDILQPGEMISITLDGSPVDIGGYNAYTTVQEYLEQVVSKLGNYGITASIENGVVVIPNWPSNATWTTTSPDIATFTHGTGDGYRFGFQGQEKDDELHGSTWTSLAFEFRMHDPRVGRFLSIDPLAAKYPHNSPYAFSENRVIDSGELEGLERYYAAGGQFIGQYGDNTEIRIVDAEHVECATTMFANFNASESFEAADAWISTTLLNEASRPTFGSPQAAGKDWLARNNPISIREGQEMESTIYRVVIDGSPLYTYTPAAMGDQGGVKNSPPPPSGAIRDASVHTHGDWGLLSMDPELGDMHEEFSGKVEERLFGPRSDGDTKYYSHYGIIGFVGTPGGRMKQYTPTTNESKTISSLIPSDPKSPSRVNDLDYQESFPKE